MSYWTLFLKYILKFIPEELVLSSSLYQRAAYATYFFIKQSPEEKENVGFRIHTATYW